MVLTILVLQLLDVLTTYHLVQRLGLTERNPFMRWAMEKIGFWPAILSIKGVFVALVLSVDIPTLLGIAIIALYVVVVLNNLKLVLDNGNS